MQKLLLTLLLLITQLFAFGETPPPQDFSSTNFTLTKTINLSGKLINPCQFTVDEKYIHVIDNFNNTVYKFDHEGDLLESLNSINGNFIQPIGIAQDESFIYITDNTSKAIIKLNKYNYKNYYTITINNVNTNFIEPSGIFVTKYQDFLLTDTVMNEFLRINVFGIIELRKGFYGPSEKTLIEPVDICADKQFIFVADQGDRSIKTYDFSGNYQSTLKGFQEIGGIAFNRGILFTADPRAKLVSLYRKTNLEMTIPANNPQDVASIGNKLFILDPVMKQVIVYEQNL